MNNPDRFIWINTGYWSWLGAKKKKKRESKIVVNITVKTIGLLGKHKKSNGLKNILNILAQYDDYINGQFKWIS